MYFHSTKDHDVIHLHVTTEFVHTLSGVSIPDKDKLTRFCQHFIMPSDIKPCVFLWGESGTNKQQWKHPSEALSVNNVWSASSMEMGDWRVERALVQLSPQPITDPRTYY